jgi:hypothetical protein
LPEEQEIAIPGHVSLVDQLGYANTFDFMALSVRLWKGLKISDLHVTNALKILVGEGPAERGPSVSPGTVRRYHAQVQQLPPASVLQKVAGFFFDELYWILPIVERPLFHELLHPWLDLRRSCDGKSTYIAVMHEVMQFGALLAQMLGVAMQLILSAKDAKETLGLDCGTNSVETLSKRFHRLGIDIMLLLGRSMPTVTSIQHSMLNMQWLKNAGFAKDAWAALGEATR